MAELASEGGVDDGYARVLSNQAGDLENSEYSLADLITCRSE